MRMGRHRRRRWWIAIVPVGAALAALGLALPAFVQRGSVSGDRAGGQTLPRSTPPTPSGTPTPQRQPTPLARWGAIELFVPAGGLVCVCYHEASYHDALPLHPRGRLVRDDNATKFPADAPDTDGPKYVIMSSRGRSTPATSAVDVVTRLGEEFRSPVSGVVTKVKAYRLYGKYPDTEVAIRPDADRRYRVVMIHLAHARVWVGERVVGGVTPLGVARLFSFSSQIDYYVEGHPPHVHVEIVDPRRPR
jgi:hypothetical protein